MKKNNMTIKTTMATEDPITYNATIYHKGKEVAHILGGEDLDRRQVRRKAMNEIYDRWLSCPDCDALIFNCTC